MKSVGRLSHHQFTTCAFRRSSATSSPASSAAAAAAAARSAGTTPASKQRLPAMIISKLLRHRSSAAAAAAAAPRDDVDLLGVATSDTVERTTTAPTVSKCPFSRMLAITSAQPQAQQLTPAAAPSPLQETTTAAAPVKTFRDLNGPPAWPLLGNFIMYIKKENRGRLHEALMEQHKVYGDMFREKLGPSTQLHVCDTAIMEHIYRFSGKYPIRPPIMAWRRVRQDQNRAFGLVTSMEGDYWHKTRKLVNEKMLTPTSMFSYIGDINDATNQMVARLRRLRNTHGSEWLTSEVMNEFYKWSLETAGLCILESRLGCLADDMPEKASQFISAIGDMMSSSLYVIVMDGLHKKLNTRYWQKHVDSWNRILDIARFYIDKKVKDIALNEAPAKEGNDSLIAHLLQSNQLTNDEIYSNITEILLAGTDTTSNTLSFALNQLATHPHVQQKLRQEIESVSRGADVTVEDLSSMPYMRATLKESMRLHPVGTMNVRVLQKDLVLDGYLIPKDTLCVLNHFAASRNEKMFDSPNEFRPERWLPGPQTNKYPINPFAVLPFGYGVRGCVGKRLALMEIKVAIVKLLKSFDLKPVPGMELKPNLRTLLTPGTHVPVQYVDRS